jgi:hypothetical protein
MTTESTSTDPRSTGSGTEPVASAVERRVAELRKRAESDPQAAREAAREAAWAWIEELNQRAGKDRAGAERELNALFRAGTPPQGLDGPTEGILVSTTTNPALDLAVRALTRVWMPWQGKRFDAAAQSGNNRMSGSSALPAKLLWSLYTMKDVEDGKLAFDFTTYVEAGKDDPDRQVLVIDYANVESNPRLIIRSIRDELVEIVPGAYLGKILFLLPQGGYTKIGYFALRTPR